MNSIILLVLAVVASATCKPVSETSSGTSNNLQSETIDASNHLPREEAAASEDTFLDPLEDEDVLEDELGDEEVMEGAENVVFRPLFAHRKREARRAAVRQRRARASERGRSFIPYQRAYRRFRPRPVYLRPNWENTPLQILY